MHGVDADFNIPMGSVVGADLTYLWVPCHANGCNNKNVNLYCTMFLLVGVAYACNLHSLSATADGKTVCRGFAGTDMITYSSSLAAHVDSYIIVLLLVEADMSSTYLS